MRALADFRKKKWNPYPYYQARTAKFPTRIQRVRGIQGPPQGDLFYPNHIGCARLTSRQKNVLYNPPADSLAEYYTRLLYASGQSRPTIASLKIAKAKGGRGQSGPMVNTPLILHTLSRLQAMSL